MKIGTFIIGLLLVLAGIVLFLLNIGYGSWESIYELTKWWPLLLIIIGLGMFSRGKIPLWIAYLIIILSVGAVSFFTIQMDKNENNSITQSTISISRQQYPDIQKGHLDIDYGGGQLSINPGNEDLLKGDFDKQPVIHDITTSSNTLRVNLRPSDSSWLPQHNNINHWQLWISPELAWNLDIDAGAVDGEIDLTGIPLTKLNCDVGAGDMDFIMGNNGVRSKINLSAGASDIKLHIPAGTGVKIELDGALTSNNLDKLGWTKIDNHYTSPHYQQAASKIDFDIDLSAGNLDVEIEPVPKLSFTT